MSGYVSCFRINGVPILPPLLTAEEKLEMRKYKQKAIEVEKKLQQRKDKKEKEMQEIESPKCLSEDEASFEVLSYIQKVLKDSGDQEEVKYLLKEVDAELKNKCKKSDLFGAHFSDQVNTNEIPSDFQEKTAFRPFGPMVVGKVSDSYCFNEEKSPTISFIDSADDGETLNHDLSKHWSDPDKISDGLVSKNIGVIIKTFNETEDCQMEEETKPDNAFLGNLNISDADVNAHKCISSSLISPPNKRDLINKFGAAYSSSPSLMSNVEILSPGEKEVSESVIQTPSELNMSLSKDKSVSPIDIKVKSENICHENTDEQTPRKIIRSNSYTLESPSPTVLVYLRNLAVGSDDFNLDGGRKNVVRNLNLFWQNDISQLDDVDEMNNITMQECLPVNNGSLYHSKEETLTKFEFLSNNKKSDEIKLLHKRTNAAIVIQSAIRGYLVRRLMKTQKVIEIKKTIKDAVLCAWSLYSEQAISPSDVSLHERIMRQVTAACYELHSIFIQWSTEEKMSLIRSDRQRLKIPRPKSRHAIERRQSSGSSSLDNSSKSSSSTHVRSKSLSGSRKAARPGSLPVTSLQSSTPRVKPWR